MTEVKARGRLAGQARQLREEKAAGASVAGLAARYGVSPTTVLDVVHGRTYADEGGPVAPSVPREVANKGGMPDAEVVEARSMRANGMTLADIAGHFHKSKDMISDLVNGRTYKDAGGPITEGRVGSLTSSESPVNPAAAGQPENLEDAELRARAEDRDELLSARDALRARVTELEAQLGVTASFIPERAAFALTRYDRLRATQEELQRFLWILASREPDGAITISEAEMASVKVPTLILGYRSPGDNFTILAV